MRRNLYQRLIFTGPIDEYFEFRFGKLPYRSLRFEHVTLDKRSISRWRSSIIRRPRPIRG